jgi:hypothetical protein
VRLPLSRSLAIRRAGEVTAQPFELVTLVGVASRTHRMQAEAVRRSP